LPARPLVDGHAAIASAQRSRCRRLFTFDLLRCAPAHGNQHLSLLFIQLRQRRADLRQVGAAGTHEQFVILAADRAALLEQRLQYRDEVLGSAILQIDHHQRLRPYDSSHQATADDQPRPSLQSGNLHVSVLPWR
jgi:hypothetical protein